MKVKALKEYLLDVSDDFDVCLTSGVLLKDKEEFFEIIYDHPIVAIAVNDDTKELRFVHEGDVVPDKFGKYKLIGKDPVEIVS